MSTEEKYEAVINTEQFKKLRKEMFVRINAIPASNLENTPEFLSLRIEWRNAVAAICSEFELSYDEYKELSFHHTNVALLQATAALERAKADLAKITETK